jgi:adenylate cyclase
MTDVIFRYDGTLNKYLGDAIMSFWNAPLNQPDHAIRACRAALDLQRRGQAIRTELAKFGAPDGLVTRIGINSGQMLVGNMGSTWKFDYTVVGDAVNYAARLEAANRFYDTRILLSESTAKLVAPHFAMRKLDLLKVKGHSAAASVYELLSEAPADDTLRRRIDAYEKALGLYQAREWSAAREILVEILRELAQDGAARMLLERIEAFQISLPPDAWDGSFDPGR